MTDSLCPRCGSLMLYPVRGASEAIGCLSCGFIFDESEVITT